MIIFVGAFFNVFSLRYLFGYLPVFVAYETASNKQFVKFFTTSAALKVVCFFYEDIIHHIEKSGSWKINAFTK